MTNFATRWVLFSGVGMSIGFLFFLNLLFFLAFGTDFDKYWSEEHVEGIENADQLLRLGLAVGLPTAGAIFTATACWALQQASGSWF